MEDKCLCGSSHFETVEDRCLCGSSHFEIIYQGQGIDQRKAKRFVCGSFQWEGKPIMQSEVCKELVALKALVNDMGQVLKWAWEGRKLPEFYDKKVDEILARPEVIEIMRCLISRPLIAEKSVSSKDFHKTINQAVLESYQRGFLDCLDHVQIAVNESIESLKQIFKEKVPEVVEKLAVKLYGSDDKF